MGVVSAIGKIKEIDRFLRRCVDWLRKWKYMCLVKIKLVLKQEGIGYKFKTCRK